MDPETPKRIDMALQGGGAHGALTWGVLDRILEDERLEIDSISGTSAGAMNAAVVADGLHRGGREQAREGLYQFWLSVSEAARLSPIQRTPWDRLIGNYSLDYSPGYRFFESLTQLLHPAQLNPLRINPLRDLIARQVDFDKVNACRKVKVYVTATDVRTGRARIFRQPHLSADAVMASACLPFMFDAVTIDGEAYWDGGYSGNPALYPLVEDSSCQDLVVVQINPMTRQQLPTTAREVVNRINEITFNSALIKELRSLYLLHQLIDAEGLELERYRAMRLHLIHAEQEIEALSASSKLNAEWPFLIRLRDQGYRWADEWLGNHFDDLGVRSTFDLDELFADAFRPIDPEGDTDESGEQPS